MMKLYYKNKILQKNLRIKSSEIGNIEFTWDYKEDIYYTLIIYDIDTPFTFVNLLVINIPRNDIEYGTILLDYINPSLNTHRYIIAVFEQTKIITNPKSYVRDKFPIGTFLLVNNLTLLDDEMIICSNNEFYLVNRSNKKNIII